MPDTLTDEHQALVEEFARCMAAFGDVLARMEAAGLDAGTALRAITDEDGNSLYDSMPLSVRMML